MNMQDVLKWIKGNVFIVVFVVLMIAALVGFPMIAGGMNEAVDQDLQARKAKFTELDKLRKTAFVDPVTNEPSQIIINENLLQDYQRIIGVKTEDAKQIHQRALAFNKGTHKLILPGGWDMDTDGPWLFPKPPAFEVELRPREFHELLTEAYNKFFRAVRVGSPPSADELQDELRRAEAQFREFKLQKGNEATLTDDEKQLLAEELGRRRLTLYAERAEDILLFCTPDAIVIPGFAHNDQPGLTEMFYWQWDFWVAEDILKTMYDVNKEHDAVLKAPVQRLLYMDITDSTAAASVSGGGGAAGGSGGAFGGGMTMGPGNKGGNNNASGPAGVAPDAKKKIDVDYTTSITGRRSNHLYDVRYVNLGLVVDVTRTPEVLDALAKQNFITILDVAVKPVDPFEAAHGGFYYGPPSLVQLDLVLETVWLREWTSVWMPDDLKRELGIAIEQPKNAAADQG